MSHEAELDFYKQLAALQKKRDAAFATKKKDPAKWQAAKHEYAEFRTTMRILGGRQTAPAAPVPETAEAGVTSGAGA